VGTCDRDPYCLPAADAALFHRASRADAALHEYIPIEV